MNGYKIMSDAYKKMVEERKLHPEEAEKDIRIFDFLSSCDEDDFYRLFDSSAFNDITKTYLDYVLHDLTSVNELSKADAEKIQERFGAAFDMMDAKTVCKKEWKRPRD